MDIYGGEVNRLIEELGRLPGIGAKTAQRLAFYIISMPEERAQALADSIVTAITVIRSQTVIFVRSADLQIGIIR